MSVDVSSSSFTESELLDIANACGYLNCDSFVKVRDDDVKINISLKDGAFQTGKIFFTNYSVLFFNYKKSGKLPNFFFTLEEKESSFDVVQSNNLLVINAYFSWKKLISMLADHHDESKDSFVFFIGKDGVAKKHVVNASVEFNELEKIIYADSCLNTASVFIDLLCRENDAHRDERKSVMRSTLSEVVDGSKEGVNILSVLNVSEKFAKEYKELYEIYIHRFSINSLLNEIDAKSLEYLGKTNELISSLQTKALAIPGGLIAIGAFSKASGILNLIVVIAGFLIATSITKKSNEVHRETLGLIEKQVEKAFDKYIKNREEKEVESAASSSKSDIIQLVNGGKDRLRSIDKISGYSVYGMVIYMICKLWLKIVS